jgi:hypothetical protein
MSSDANPQVPFDIKSGVGALQDAVTAYFGLYKVDAPVVFGWRERAKQPLKNGRIVFTPSDDDGSAGEFHYNAKYPGPYTISKGGTVVGEVRALASWSRRIVVAVWAQDPTAPADERKQCEAVEALLEWFWRGVKASSFNSPASIRVDGMKWTNDPTELKAGAELRMWLSLDTPLFDVPLEVAFPATAGITPDPAKAA